MSFFPSNGSEAWLHSKEKEENCFSIQKYKTMTHAGWVQSTGPQIQIDNKS